MGYGIEKLFDIHPGAYVTLSQNGKLAGAVKAGQVNLQSLAESWSLQCRIGVVGLRLTDNRIYLLYRDGKLISLDVKTGQEIMSCDIDPQPGFKIVFADWSIFFVAKFLILEVLTLILEIFVQKFDFFLNFDYLTKFQCLVKMSIFGTISMFN